MFSYMKQAVDVAADEVVLISCRGKQSRSDNGRSQRKVPGVLGCPIPNLRIFYQEWDRVPVQCALLRMWYWTIFQHSFQQSANKSQKMQQKVTLSRRFDNRQNKRRQPPMKNMAEHMGSAKPLIACYATDGSWLVTTVRAGANSATYPQRHRNE